MLDSFLSFTDTAAFKCIFLCMMCLFLTILRMEFKHQHRIGISYAIGILSLFSCVGAIIWGYFWLNNGTII